MGYRLHYAKQFKVEWDGGYFSGGDVDKVAELLMENCETFHSDENSDIWEVDKEELKEYIEQLKKTKMTSTNKYFDESGKDMATEGYTNGDLVEILTEILEGSEPSESYIRMEWF